ncbi:hypothetical protein KGMB02408_02480 [Bacteroides faecalis]|uniref:Uncharacterized protein n=2 Tax=Bacteroides faecalis TaxID=2447885 RepID=A0A401LNU3_9BACE|nr:hypothetical protein KGMB02408_01850 [Bacteroides faecalis]GCB33303.1 hypothetical protein KGMB02408_02480 [Bacteroides faecalis]
MMKTIKYLLFILFCCYTTLSYSQVESVLNDNILSPDSIAKAVKSMCDKLEQAKQKVKENPKDERAWLEYSGVLQILKGASLMQSMTPSKKYPTPDPNIQKEMDEMLEGMKQNIPNTATYAITRNSNIKPGEKRMSFDEIIEKWPDAVLHYPTYVAVSLRNEKRLKDICKRWYESGEFPPQQLNFAYNELASAEKNAIIFMGGCFDLYGVRVLQSVKDQFNDKKIIMYPFLTDSFSIDKVTEELGIPKYRKAKNDTISYSSPGDFMKSYSRELKGVIEHFAKYSNRPIYFTITMDEMAKNALKDNLHSEGLLMRYSSKPYDNLAVMRRNFENVYLMDYLRESFYPQTLAVSAFDPKVNEGLNLYYVPALKALLQFYKESEDHNHYDKLYSILRTVIDDAKSCTKEVREQYLKSINS